MRVQKWRCPVPVILAVAGMLAASCARGALIHDTAYEGVNAGPARGGGPSAGSDGEAMAIAEALHIREIHAAELALERSVDPRVRAMAESVRERHAQALARQDANLGLLGFRPQDNSLAASIRHDGEQSVRTLLALRGDEFDRAFVASQIARDERSLELMEQAVLPRASLDAVRQMIAADRAAAAQSLDEARSLEFSVTSGDQR